MKKNIAALKIPEEEKVLLSKIDKKVPFLSKKADQYFNSVLTVKSENIKEAYSANEDLISILNSKNEEIEKLKEESLKIEQEHRKNATIEFSLSITEEQWTDALIKSTIEQKDDLVKLDEKERVLSKRKKYINKRGAKRKATMIAEINELKRKVEDSSLLNIEPMKEDIKLIEKFIDPKEIKTNGILIGWVSFISIVILALLMAVMIIWM